MNSRHRPALTATGRRLPRACIWLLKAALPLAPLSACAVSNTPVDIGEGFPDASSAPSQTFTPPPDEAGSPDVSLPPPSLCIDTECRAPYGTCATSRFKCDIDFSSDNANCGGCGIACPSYDALNMGTQCSNGVCVMHCGDNLDCNGLVDDGCETFAKLDPNNCGGCGVKCKDGEPCILGVCGCLAPKIFCNGTCVDPTKDDRNCGACGNECDGSGLPAAPPHMGYNCSGSVCNNLGCEQGWADCNGDVATKGYESDGCEVPLGTATDCEACGDACATGEKCAKRLPDTTTSHCSCDAGTMECSNACVDIASDPNNCGGCKIVCPGAAVSGFNSHATPICRSGVCGLTCDTGWADCDSKASNGCEINTARDPGHCGSCTNACDGSNGQPCITGTCATKPCEEGPTK